MERGVERAVTPAQATASEPGGSGVGAAAGEAAAVAEQPKPGEAEDELSAAEYGAALRPTHELAVT